MLLFWGFLRQMCVVFGYQYIFSASSFVDRKISVRYDGCQPVQVL